VEVSEGRVVQNFVLLVFARVLTVLLKARWESGIGRKPRSRPADVIDG